MIKNELTFVNIMFQRLDEGSLVRNSLLDKTFNHQQYRPFCFHIFAEFIASLNLYKITNELRFLELLEQNIDMIICERDRNYGHIDESRKKIGHGWGCRYLIEGLWTYDVMTASCIAFPISLYIIECLKNRNISQSRTTKIKQYLQICQNVADDFLDDIRESKMGAYLQQAVSTEIEPSNHTAVYICLLLLIFKLTGIQKYFLAAKKLASYIKASFRECENGTICWPYRGDTINQKSTHGERYWKSTWVVYAILLCYQHSCVFNERDMNMLSSSVKMNLIRNGVEVYDSLSPQAGILVDRERIEYHARKGQEFSLKRFINFMPLAIFDNEIANNIAMAVKANDFYHNACINFDSIENYCLLDGMTCFLDYKHSVFNFNFDFSLSPLDEIKDVYA